MHHHNRNQTRFQRRTQAAHLSSYFECAADEGLTVVLEFAITSVIVLPRTWATLSQDSVPAPGFFAVTGPDLHLLDRHSEFPDVTDHNPAFSVIPGSATCGALVIAKGLPNVSQNIDIR